MADSIGDSASAKPTARRSAPLKPVSLSRRIPLLFPLAAFGLYTLRLDAQSLWYDEAVSAWLASMSLPDLVRWTAHDIQPPLYYVLLHAWMRGVGTSEWALRFFSAWWGVLVVALGAALARRLTRSRVAATLAAVLFTLAPWNVYYSQEARMYTVFVALALALAWVDISTREEGGWRWWSLWGVLGLALLYTHYFGLFLLIAFSLWTGYTRLRHGNLAGPTHRIPASLWRTFRAAVRPLLLPWGIILGGYLPWLPFLITRFREDASYWGGTLKVGEALRHWWVHMTLGAPETFLEVEAVRWLPLFIAVTVAEVLGVSGGRRVPGERSAGEGQEMNLRITLGWLLTWFLLPPMGILLLAYRSPKFNPRYLMLVYPAWILLLVLPLARGRVPHGRGRVTRLVLRSPAFLPLLLIPLFIRADLAWFTDPAFTKPDFRGAIAYIRAHRAADEPVLLISGHMRPVFDYYAPDIPRYPLPDIEVLDVTQVLGFDVASEINRAIAGASGVWLLLWQDEVVDPMGVVPYLLSYAGEEDRSIPNAFWHVRVRHFVLPPDARVPEVPPVARSSRANWANVVELLGYTQHTDRVALFFRPLQGINEDLHLHMEVWDDAGFLWGQADARPGPYVYPTTRWQPGNVVLGLHPIPLINGTPAGTYTLRVRLYSERQPNGLDVLDAAGNPTGKDVLLPDIAVLRPRPLPPSEVEEQEFPPLPPARGATDVVTYSLTAVAADWPTLDAVRVWPPPPWEPGQRVYAQLRWRFARAPRDREVFTLALMAEGIRHRLVIAQFGAGEVEAGAWPRGARLFAQVRFRVPRDVTPGTWTLAVEVRARDTDVQAVQEIARVNIQPSQRVFDVPRVTYPTGVVFGDVMRLVGVDMDPQAFRPGATVPITLTWQSVQEVDISYTAFVHLLGPDGRLLAQEDHIPCRGACPTDGWLAGEVLRDRYDLELPRDLPKEGLVLEIGVYDAARPGFPRLKITETGEDAFLMPVPP